MKHKLIFSSAYCYAAMEEGQYSETFSIVDGTLNIAGKEIEVECKTKFNLKIKKRQFKTLKTILKRIPEQPIVLTVEDYGDSIDFEISFQF